MDTNGVYTKRCWCFCSADWLQTQAADHNSSGPLAPNAFASFNQQSNAFSINTPQPVPSGSFGFQSTTSKPAPGPNTSQNNQTAFNFNVPDASFTAPVLDAAKTSSGTDAQTAGDPVDTSIWLKEKWNPGEIPEQAPLKAFV